MEFDIATGKFVRALNIPEWVLDAPTSGLVGVVVAPRDHYGDGAGPLVRWQDGRTCNVYHGWVEVLEGSLVVDVDASV